MDLASRELCVGLDVPHKSTDFYLPTTNFTTLGELDTRRLAAILPHPFWGRANNKNDQDISPVHKCLPNVVEIRAHLGTQNTVTNFLHFGGHFATPVLSTGKQQKKSGRMDRPHMRAKGRWNPSTFRHSNCCDQICPSAAILPRPFWVRVLHQETFLVALMFSTRVPIFVCLWQIYYFFCPFIFQ